MNTKVYSLGQVGDYEIKQLKVFKTVVDCGGFSAAETSLNIGRSTISLHISNLESRLNLVLCKRGRGGFSLTEEGHVIYDMTKKLLASLDQFRLTVNHLNAKLTGEIHIALSDDISLDSRSQFPQLIKQFNRQAPEVLVHADVASMTDIERMVLNDNADVGFIPYHRQLDGLDYIHLYSDICYIYAATEHPLAALPAQEQNQQVENYPATHAGLKPHEEVSEQITSMNLRATSYFYDARLALILSGAYIGFLPEKFASDYVSQGQITPVATASKHYRLGVAAITKKTASINKTRELFKQLLLDNFAQNTGTGTAPY